MRWLVGIGVLVGTACGPVTMQQRAEEAEKSGDWAKAMANYDYEYEHAAYRDREKLAPARDKAATKWMESELGKARTALTSDDAETAFGIATTLTREAKKRKRSPAAKRVR